VVQGKPSIIGNGVVVDPWHLVGEIEKIQAQGVAITPDILTIADNACLILPIHPALDVAREAAASAPGAKIGTTPEQMDTMLLDASLIGITTKVTTGDELKAAVGKVQKYVTDTPALSINLIIGYLVKEAKIDPALALLLSRRLVFLQVPVLDVKTLTPFDVGLIKGHLANQLEQLDFF
jgi:hypothetical protein